MYKLSLFADWKVGDTGYPTSKQISLLMLHCCIAELPLGAPYPARLESRRYWVANIKNSSSNHPLLYR